MQVSSIMSRSQNVNGQNIQNIQMQSLLQMKGNHVDQNGDFFGPDPQMQSQQGPNTNFINPNLMRASQFH